MPKNPASAAPTNVDEELKKIADWLKEAEILLVANLPGGRAWERGQGKNSSLRWSGQRLWIRFEREIDGLIQKHEKLFTQHGIDMNAFRKALDIRNLNLGFRCPCRTGPADIESFRMQIQDLRKKLRKSAVDQGLPALSKKAAAVYDILIVLPPHRAMTGRDLVDELRKKRICIAQSTLTSRIIPELKPYGVENARRKGYRILEKKLPSRHN